jgi:hypothetical protein
MDETWVNKNHHRGFTWKRVVDMGTYADKDGRINRLPVGYEGDMDLPTGKGERLIVLHFSKLFSYCAEFLFNVLHQFIKNT